MRAHGTRRRQPAASARAAAGEALPHRAAILHRVAAGEAVCAICRQAIRPGEDVVITPDFLADDTDPFWRFAATVVHRPCFLVWHERKAFRARYNRVARTLATEDGARPVMTGEGDIVWRHDA